MFYPGKAREDLICKHCGEIIAQGTYYEEFKQEPYHLECIWDKLINNKKSNNFEQAATFFHSLEQYVRNWPGYGYDTEEDYLHDAELIKHNSRTTVIENLIAELNSYANLNEDYTEEPDAFETQSEREMQKELGQQLDKEAKRKEDSKYWKERMAGMKRVYDFLEKMKETRDVCRTKDRNWTYTRCWIPQSAFTKFTAWNDKQDNLLKRCHLKMTRENASQGYYVTIS